MLWLVSLSVAAATALLLTLLITQVDHLINNSDDVYLTALLRDSFATTSENEEGEEVEQEDTEGEENTDQDTEEEEEEDGNRLDQIIEKSFVEKTALPNNTLTLVSYTLVRDPILDDPILEVQGEIRNDGTAAQEFVRINATFYNDEDEIVGTDYAYADSDVLEVCQLAPFELSVGFEDDVPIDEIDYIKFHLDSQVADEDEDDSDVEGDSSVSETGEPEGDLTEPGEC
jgi:hypothetical protein